MSTECIVAIVICIIIGGFCSYKAYSSGLKEGKSEEYYRLQRERDELKRLRKQIEQEQMETQVKCEALIKSTNRECQERLGEIDAKRRELQYDIDRVDGIEAFVEAERKGILSLAEQASAGSFASLVADCMQRFDFAIAKLLESKDRPAYKAAERVREISESKKVIEQQMLMYKYRACQYEELFPWLAEFYDRPITELTQEVAPPSEVESDPVRGYLSDVEWFRLPENQRNQCALDRYVASRKKTKWQIGRDYEMYIAHLLRTDGYDVECTGTLYRFEDLGRDLIAKKGNKVAIIQCKYWSKDKVIHEKHVFQLFGTTTCYQLDHPRSVVVGVLVTNTKCTKKTHDFAKKMGVLIREGMDIGAFPRIKCHISSTGERIYHLPMDQQYDRTVIDGPWEFFALTVEEAVSKGFRRAYRWHGQ